jgi:Mn-dependent DtxR family transcriptional regulator
MSQRAQTKDERYMQGLYELAQAAGSWEADFDMVEVGEHVGLSAKPVKAIVALLARANFVKKIDKKRLRITEHGRRLVHELQAVPVS